MVQKVKVNSSNVRYDNRNDESRVYDIEANVNITGTEVVSTDGGIVYKDGAMLAQFNTWSGNHFNITFMDVEVEERNAINLSVDAFITEVKEMVSNE